MKLEGEERGLKEQSTRLDSAEKIKLREIALKRADIA